MTTGAHVTLDTDQLAALFALERMHLGSGETVLFPDGRVLLELTAMGLLDMEGKITKRGGDVLRLARGQGYSIELTPRPNGNEARLKGPGL
jgi:hypothetical protein